MKANVKLKNTDNNFTIALTIVFENSSIIEVSVDAFIEALHAGAGLRHV